MKLKLFLIGLIAFSMLSNYAYTQDTEETRITIETDIGDIKAVLYPDAAPITVANFINNIKAGLYENGSFYRASRIDNYPNANYQPLTLIQGGKNGDKQSLPAIEHETTTQTGISHLNGVLSMARGAPGSATSEFFICIDDNSGLDTGSDRYEEGQRQGYASFGRVTAGMDLVLRIQQLATGGQKTDEELYSAQSINEPVLIKNILLK